MQKEFIYVDHVIEDEFEYNVFTETSEDNVVTRRLSELEFAVADKKRAEQNLKELNKLADQAKFTTLLS